MILRKKEKVLCRHKCEVTERLRFYDGKKTVAGQAVKGFHLVGPGFQSQLQLLVQLPANVHSNRKHDSSSSWSPVTHRGELQGALPTLGSQPCLVGT